MASVTVDKRTGNHLVRSYAGVNPQTRRPMQVSETLPANASEAEIEAAGQRCDARAAVTKGNSALMTVGTLLDWHLDNMEADGASPTTMSAYRSYARRHVKPRIGSVRVEAARPATFSRFYRDLRRDRDQGGAGLSVATVEKIHAMLSGMFTKAATDGLLERNPLAGVKPPRGMSPEARPLTAGDMGRLVAWIDSALSAGACDDAGFERYGLALIVATARGTGLRRGELAGLRLDSVRPRWAGALDPVSELRVTEAVVRRKGVGWVYKPPKSASSRRPVAVDESLGRALADWLDLTGLDDPSSPLFFHADGSMWTPDDIADGFKLVCREAGLAPWVHLHTLRHTHATYLLEHGENVRAVQERLGHKSASTTLNIYGHVMPGRGAEAARAFEEASRAIVGSSRAAPARAAPTCPLTGSPCARFAPAPPEK
ncbi:MAG: site-specific integrase [Adlercreutzia sp.]|nr:site-specific integrase [Adlercreutzia sp.]